MRSFIRLVRVVCAYVRVSCVPHLVSAFPNDLISCVILFMKVIRVIIVAGLVQRVGSHKTRLDNQNAYADCFKVTCIFIYRDFRLSPHCFCQQRRNVKLLLAEKKNVISHDSVRLNFFLHPEYVDIKTRGTGLFVVHVWWNQAPCCEQGFRLCEIRGSTEVLISP